MVLEPREPEPIEIRKFRDPYNPKYCKKVKCQYRQGNQCTIDKCVRNHKMIVYWEMNGVLHPGDSEEE